MALKLTVILLVLLFAVLQFAGHDVDGGPFAETPGIDPAEVLLAVAPLEVAPQRPNPPLATPDTRLPPAVTNVAPVVRLDTPAAANTAPQTSGQSALDMVILDPSAARNSLTVAPQAESTPPAPTDQSTGAQTALSKAEVTGSSVNLRAGPSTSNAVLGRAQGGDLVEWVSDPAPGWALIRHPDIDGDLYMSSQFLRRIAN